MTRNANVGRSKSADARKLECPACGHEPVNLDVRSIPFVYGEGANAVELKATVPLYSCTSCGTQFLDRIGEERQHEAVCAHLRVLTPARIAAIRKRYGMTRAEFARATALGEATLARWERGVLIQNEAYDRYLRLLEDLPTFRHVLEMSGSNAEHGAERKVREYQFGQQPKSNAKRFRMVVASSFSDAELSYNPVRRTG